MTTDEKKQDVEAKPQLAQTLTEIRELIKAAAWPVVALIMFLGLFTPIRALVAELPHAVGRANVVSIGQVRVELSNALSATPEVQEGLKGLKGSSVRALLQLNLPRLVCDFTNDPAAFVLDRVAHRELQGKKLVDIRDRPTDDTKERKNCYEARLTELGKRTQDFLHSFLITSLRLET